jgi:hypothetical protein
MRMIRPSRRVKTLEDLAQGLLLEADVRSACAQHDLVAAAGELERVDLAALLEPPTERVDHLLAAVTDPLLAQPLPADVWNRAAPPQLRNHRAEGRRRSRS